MDMLVPVEGCWVRLRDTKRVGRVLENRSDGRVHVQWLEDRTNAWHSMDELSCGFNNGWVVQDVPVSRVRTTLGGGRVRATRTLGGRDQVLVQLFRNGQSVWLPYENLRRIQSAELIYERAQTTTSDPAEHFRLRMFAHALESWNQITGALDRFEVDPLPHQIHLVHRILTSGNTNWLIADDVGLGKTIEVGLLLAALKARKHARRVMVVAPAGLTLQWQQEMALKFNGTYVIYGRDFQVNDRSQWKLYDHVIVSIDLAKREEHMEVLRGSGSWDVVIFDEAHKLTKIASGERAQRYRLAEMLRSLTDSMLLLTATPHQGRQDKFISLLELVRPDLRDAFATLAANPEVVSEVILRNRKSEVTDAEGRLIFSGQKTHRVPVPLSEAAKLFDAKLKLYLRHGYKAGEEKGAAGRAIGFVMTTYRKLASSSVAAIEHALKLRRARLIGEFELPLPEWEDDDFAAGGDEQDNLAELGAGAVEAFFGDEASMLDDLIECAREVRREDWKLGRFIEEVVRPVHAEGKKLLIFTEYCATQLYLQEALQRTFPDLPLPVLINGSMSIDEKRESIARFHADARFLISTEAGGEGINLQRACHIMVNYDLPWNPSRLVQRIGRLYRYGQAEPVIVFNLHARDTFDNAAIDLMLQRVDQIVADMAPVGEEFNERLHADIIGELLEQVDFATLLEEAKAMSLELASRQIDDALEKAKQAQQLQAEILSHASKYDPSALQGTVGFTTEHVQRFVEQMLGKVLATIEHRSHGGRVLQVRLPEDLVGRFPEFGRRAIVRMTAHRSLAQQVPDVVPMDFAANFFRFLVAAAQDHDFDGYYASTRGPAEGTLAGFRIRWQNDQGEPLSEEFLPLHRDREGRISVNPAFVMAWLMEPAESCSPPEMVSAERRQDISELRQVAEREFERQANRFRHPNDLVLLAAGDFQR